LLPKPIEEQLVQDHGVHRDELLALEAVDEKAGSVRVIERGQLLVDQVEAARPQPKRGLFSPMSLRSA
jgi:hypothetical protein